MLSFLAQQCGLYDIPVEQIYLGTHVGIISLYMESYSHSLDSLVDIDETPDLLRTTVQVLSGSFLDAHLGNLLALALSALHTWLSFIIILIICRTICVTGTSHMIVVKLDHSHVLNFFVFSDRWKRSAATKNRLNSS